MLQEAGMGEGRGRVLERVTAEESADCPAKLTS